MHFTTGWPLRIAASFLFMLDVGCSGTPQQVPGPPITIATSSPSVAASSTTPDANESARQDTGHRTSKCAPDGAFPPLPPEPNPPPTLPCRPAEIAAEQIIANDVKARFRPTRNQSTVEVTFGCDALDRFISRVVLETAGGHEGSFALIEISRPDPNRVTYDVMGIRLSPTMIANPKSPFEMMRATLSQETVYAWMPIIRAALRTTIEERAPQFDPKSRTGGGSAFGSSLNFHVFIRVEDTSSRAMDGHYTGYESSLGQTQYLPLQRARRELEQALAGSTWHADSPPDEIRRFFERSFVQAQKRFSEDSGSWIRDRYVKLAAHAGTRALIPSLLPLLRPVGNDASSARTRDMAFETLVALTGWDPRAPKNGQHPRTIEAAANDFIEECGIDRIGSASDEPPL